MTEAQTTDRYYEMAAWPLGTRVTDDGERVGVLVRGVARFWVDRARKPPMVRWENQLDAEEVPWDTLRRPS